MIIFDTETTGLPKSSVVDLKLQPKIIEFAAIKLDDKTLEEVERLEFLCNPQEKLEQKITDITRLTDADLQNKKPFEFYISDIVNFFLKEKYLIAHNIAFDMTLLTLELRRLNMLTKFPYPPIQICTVTQTLKLLGYRLSMTNMHKYLFGVDYEEKHRAMNDVEALVKCFKELLNREIIKL
jgi:DNA polymerase III subunit alpha